MAWYDIVLIVYGGIGFILGVVIAVLSLDWEYYWLDLLFMILVIIPLCVLIGVPLLIIGAFQWLLDR